MDAARPFAWANPSSVHGAGRKARSLLERAREQLAAALAVDPAEVLLTSGGTEACNLALRGLALPSGSHVLTTAIEHPAVAKPLAARCRERGLELSELAVPEGRAPSPEAFAAALRPTTQLAAVQWINHETGNVLPV